MKNESNWSQTVKSVGQGVETAEELEKKGMKY